MPYIAVKCFPRDKELHEKLAEKLNEVLMETWGVQQHQVTISIENVPKEEWDERVWQPEVETHLDNMYYLKGEKKF